MEITVVFLLGFAPGIFWLWYFYHRDKIEPEPKQLIIRTFFVGLAAAIPAAIAESLFVLIPGMDGLVLLVVVAPVIEEYFKYLAVRVAIYRHAEFDEPMDGIVYAAAAALGFASIENVGYLFSSKNNGGWGAVQLIFIVRALLSVPGHVLFSSVWGAALGRAKFMSDPSAARRLIQSGLIGAMILHGLFNFSASLSVQDPVLIWVSLLGLITLNVLAWVRIRQRMQEALLDSPHGRRATQEAAEDGLPLSRRS
jgi:RsiW-degrading membrane proteinase PrsW (M82 family)